jgi:large subunit ribosomal protein L10
VDRAEKREFVTTLNSAFKGAGSIVVAHYAGLTVAQMQTLRRQMKSQGATVKVAKNRLAKLALDGTGVADFSTLLKGPTILAFAKDPVAAPKVATDFAKGHDKFVVLGGALGNTSLDANGVKALATMPSLGELRAKLLGVLQAPATKLVGTLQAPSASLVRVLAAKAKQGEAA